MTNLDVTEDTVLVANVLRGTILEHKQFQNIVENPSVGALVAPFTVCVLIDLALAAMLEETLDWRATRVRVVCTVNHRRRLVLEVTDDSARRNPLRQFKLPGIGEIAKKLGGDLSFPPSKDGALTARVSVPLNQPPPSLAG